MEEKMSKRKIEDALKKIGVKADVKKFNAINYDKELKWAASAFKTERQPDDVEYFHIDLPDREIRIIARQRNTFGVTRFFKNSGYSTSECYSNIDLVDGLKKAVGIK